MLRPADAGTVSVRDGVVTVDAHRRAELTVVYQRERADGSYRDVSGTRVTLPVIPK